MLVSQILKEKGREVLSISPEATLQEAAVVLTRHRIGALIVRGAGGKLSGIMETMTRCRFRHMPVVQHDQVTGIISIGDVVKLRIDETLREAQALKEYIATA